MNALKSVARTQRVNQLSATVVISYLFYQPMKSLLFGIQCVFKHQDLQMFGLKFN